MESLAHHYTPEPTMNAITQPQVDTNEYTLLATGYEWNDYTFDLYGYEGDEDGEMEVIDVAPVGTLLSLGMFMSRADLNAMSDWAERKIEQANKDAFAQPDVPMCMPVAGPWRYTNGRI